ncbi:MAG: tetratricopeptide repeat protein [Bacteroidia bacterium]
MRSQENDPGKASDLWLELSKQFRKTNLDSSQACLTRAALAAKRSGDAVRQQRCNMSQSALNWMQGDLEAAEKGYLQALEFWRGRKDTVEVARCCLNLGTVCYGARKPQEALRYHQLALRLTQDGDQRLIAAQAAGSISSVWFDLSEPDSLRRYAEIAIARFRALNDSANLARAYANLGYHLRELGMSMEARPPYLEALKYLEGTDELGLQGEIHEGFGTLEYRVGNYREAIDHFLTSRSCFTQLQWHKRIADNNSLIGICFKNMGRLAVAKGYFAEAYRLADSIGNNGVAATALSNLAGMELDQKEYARAIDMFQKAIRLQQQSPSRESLYDKYMGLSRSFQGLGRADSSEHYLDLAYRDAIERRDAHLTADCHLESAKRLLEGKQYKVALVKLDSAYKWASMGQNAFDLQQTYSLRSQCREAMGDYKGALQDQRLASQWQDSVHVLTSNTQLMSLEAAYWSDRKQHSLELAKKNEALNAKEAERAQANSEKLAAQRNLLLTALALTIVFGAGLYWLNLKRRRTVLLRRMSEMRMTALRAQMNPHFIFNALGSVQLLINTSAIREANLYLSKFAQLLRITLERSDVEYSTLEDELEALRLYIDLEALRFKFDYTIEVEPSLEPAHLRFPTLLLQPMVENAVKHGLSAKPQGGSLSIRVSKVGPELLCAIMDNGQGRAAVANKRRSAPDGERRSFGLKITQERLKYIHPSNPDALKISDPTHPDGSSAGTLVEIRIPYQSTDA